jgi:hypothetical protein
MSDFDLSPGALKELIPVGKSNAKTGFAGTNPSPGTSGILPESTSSCQNQLAAKRKVRFDRPPHF